MAKKIITRLIDDLDGGEAAETVQFAYDGVQYTIDLSKKNAAKLRKGLQPYVDNGVKVTPGKSRRSSAATDDQTTEGRARIREWAKKHMFDHFPPLGDRGRIPREIVAAYMRAHGIRG
jgi:hypothetical protein